MQLYFGIGSSFWLILSCITWSGRIISLVPIAFDGNLVFEKFDARQQKMCIMYFPITNLLKPHNSTGSTPYCISFPLPDVIISSVSIPLRSYVSMSAEVFAYMVIMCLLVSPGYIAGSPIIYLNFCSRFPLIPSLTSSFQHRMLYCLTQVEK